MNLDKFTKDLSEMTSEQQYAVLDKVAATVKQNKQVREQSIAQNVDLVMQALKKIEGKMYDRVSQAADKVETVAANVKDGKDGRDGKDGKAGKDGVQGPKGVDGRNGKDGKDGKDGRDGVDGISVSNAFLDFDNSLVIELSNGKQINVGGVLGEDLANKVKVIANGGGTSQYVVDALAALQLEIDAIVVGGLPSQTGNAGKFLTTDGVNASWASVAGGLSYQGTWNASTNSPALASGTGTNGYYYVVSTSGSTNLDGITDWVIGDWLLFNGTVWQKIDQTNLVTSVNSKTGAVVLSTTDVAEGSSLYYTDARARASISAGTGISYSSTTGVITNSSPDQTVSLTQGGTTTISGTYPNFTVSSSDAYTGTVTSITAGTGLSGGTITTSGTIALNNTSVTAGSYTNANITVDAQGRVTSASNGSSGGATLVFPFYTSSGISDTIALISNAYLPFFNSSGVAKNIALI